MAQQQSHSKHEEKEIVVDFQRAHTQYSPLTINSAAVNKVDISEVFIIITLPLAKKAQQCLDVLHKLRRTREYPDQLHNSVVLSEDPEVHSKSCIDYQRLIPPSRTSTAHTWPTTDFALQMT